MDPTKLTNNTVKPANKTDTIQAPKASSNRKKKTLENTIKKDLMDNAAIRKEIIKTMLYSHERNIKFIENSKKEMYFEITDIEQNVIRTITINKHNPLFRGYTHWI